MATNISGGITTPTSTTHTGNGTTGPFSISFEYSIKDDIQVFVGGVLKTVTTHYTFPNNFQITFTSGNAPSNGEIIIIQRNTIVASASHFFSDASVLTAVDLNQSNTQVLHGIQELVDDYVKRDGSQTIKANLVFEGSTDDNNETTLAITNPTADRTITLPDTTGTVVTTGDTGTINSTMIADGTIATADIANDSINADKIPDDTINSEHYVDQSIDTQHIANLNITTAKLDNNSVTTGKIADLNVTRGKLENDAIDGTKLADNAVNSEHYTDGSIDHVHLANDIIDGDNIQDDVVNSEHIAAGALDNEHYAAGSITSDKLDSATVITQAEQGSATTNDTSFLTSAAADARFFNISSGDTIKDGQTFPDNDTTIATTAAINDRIIDIVNDVGGFDIQESEQHFPNSNPQGQAGSAAVLSIKSASTNLVPSGTTLTITNGNLADDADITITGVTSTIPQGFGFLVESTNTLHTYTFHRLVPKATEVTTVAGVASNVTTVAGIAANTTTVAGISSNVTTVAGIASNVTAVANNSSNINSAVSNETNINAAVSNATNINTVAGSISNVNTVSGSIASVNNASANIASVNNFGDKYQIAANNPSTDGGGNALAVGDLYFNTSANELKVYNGTAWQSGVTATGNFATTTGNTFTGDNRYNDGVKILVGTGSDLEIFHHVSNGSFINDAGTSTLKLQTGGVTKLEIQSTGIGVTGNITVSGTVDGRDVAADGTSLDDFEAGNLTTNVTNGNIKLTPNGTGVAEVKGAGGNDGTLQLNCSDNSHGVKIKSPPHSAAQSYTLTLPSSIVNGAFLKTDSSGNLSFAAVNTDLVNDTSPQLGGDLQSNGNDIDFADGDKAVFGADGDLQIYHDGSNSRIIDSGTGDFIFSSNQLKINNAGNTANMAKFLEGGAVELYHNGTKKFETTAGGATVNGVLNVTSHLDMNDSDIIKLGDDDDLQIYHSGTHGSINNYTGNLYIQNNVGGDVGGDIHIRAKTAENSISCLDDGAVQLYHDNSKKFETTSFGSEFFGDAGIARTAGGYTFREVAGGNERAGIHSNANNDLIFKSNAAVEVGRFIGSGNTGRFGIGTTSPGAPLHVVSDANNMMQLVSTDRYSTMYLVDSVGSTFIQCDSGVLRFGVGGGAGAAGGESEAMRIGSTGLVGIGTDSPQNDLHIESATPGIRLSDSDNSSAYCLLDANGANLNIHADKGDTVDNTTIGFGVDNAIQFNVDSVGAYFVDNKKLRFGSGGDLQIYHDGSHSRIVDAGTGNLVLQTSALNINNADGTEAIIHGTAGGAVDLYHNDSKKLETTSTGVTVTGTVTATSFSGAFPADLRQSTDVDCNVGNSSDSIFFDASHGIRFYTDGAEEMRLENDGDLHVDANVVAYSTTVSDLRLKKDVEIIENPLEILDEINGYTFTYKKDDKKSAGVVAQEIEKVFPQAVLEKALPFLDKEEEPKTYKTVEYDQIVGLLVQAVKELSDKVKKLEEK